jgi:hypothetical protein
MPSSVVPVNPEKASLRRLVLRRSASVYESISLLGRNRHPAQDGYGLGHQEMAGMRPKGLRSRNLSDVGECVDYHSLLGLASPRQVLGAFVRNGDYFLKWIAAASRRVRPHRADTCI